MHRSVLQTPMTRRAALLAAGGAALAPLLPIRVRGAAAQDDVTLTLVAYSTPREAYEAIIPLFQATPEGQGIRFETSFAGSTEQSRAVEGGLPADVLALSLAPDIDRLIEPGLVAEDWANDDYKGMVTDSVVVLIVRPGNPKGVAGWEDLLREDLEVITPNPLTSGGARWNIMAAYGAQLKLGKTEEEAVAYLGQLFEQVPVLDKSARESLATFQGGKGDVLLGYENEAITAQQKGEELEFVVPDQTILIENPVAITTESAHPEDAAAFIDFIRSPAAQRVFVEKGYRPVNAEVQAEATSFPAPAALFTIADLGGWDAVTTAFFDPDNGVVAKVLPR